MTIKGKVFRGEKKIRTKVREFWKEIEGMTPREDMPKKVREF